jgi:hypothetical protein
MSNTDSAVDVKLLESVPDGILAKSVAAISGVVPLILILWVCGALYQHDLAKTGRDNLAEVKEFELYSILLRSGGLLIVLLAVSRPFVLDVLVGFLWDTVVVQRRGWWRRGAGISRKLTGALIYGTIAILVGWFGWVYLDSPRAGRIETLAARVDLVEAINDVIADTQQPALPKAERSAEEMYFIEERLLSSVERRYKRLDRAISGSRHDAYDENVADKYLAYCLEELPTSDERLKELRKELEALRAEELPAIVSLLERIAALEDVTEHTAEGEMVLQRAKAVVGWAESDQKKRRRRRMRFSGD